MTAGNPAYDELCCYTLSHGAAEFIHQYVVDAEGAQQARAGDKPIRLVFSLIGLYLHVERGFTGREVQLAHMKLAQKKREWPKLELPTERGSVTAQTVLAAPLERRDAMIHEWSVTVWNAFSVNRAAIEGLLAEAGITDSRSSRGSPTSGAHREKRE